MRSLKDIHCFLNVLGAVLAFLILRFDHSDLLEETLFQIPDLL